MSVYVTKRDGKIDTINIMNEECESFLSLLETLVNTTDITRNESDGYYSNGFAIVDKLLGRYI